MVDVGDFTIRGVFGSLPKRRVVFGWDFLGALVIVCGGIYPYTHYIKPIGAHVAVVGDYVSISGALFGVIIAGFAIVAALVDEKYGRIMRRANVTPYNVLRHFLVEGTILVATLLFSVGYRATATRIHSGSAVAEECLFGIATFLFIWALFGALQLMRLVLTVAVSSMTLVGDSEPEKSKQAS
jgi:hypothetical protein